VKRVALLTLRLQADGIPSVPDRALAGAGPSLIVRSRGQWPAALQAATVLHTARFVRTVG
jgi:hypothetical protein